MRKVFKWFEENGSVVLIVLVVAMVFGCMLLPFMIAIARELWTWALS